MQQLDGYNITKVINERGNSACCGGPASKRKQASLNRDDPYSTTKSFQSVPQGRQARKGDNPAPPGFFLLLEYKLNSWKKARLRMMMLYLGMEWTMETMSFLVSYRNLPV